MDVSQIFFSLVILYQSGQTHIWYYIIYFGTFHLGSLSILSTVGLYYNKSLKWMPNSRVMERGLNCLVLSELCNIFIFWCKRSISALCLNSQCHVDLAGDGSLKNLNRGAPLFVILFCANFVNRPFWLGSKKIRFTPFRSKKTRFTPFRSKKKLVVPYFCPKYM